MKKIYHRIKQTPRRQKRHTHRTAAGLEDAVAVLMDIARDIEALSIRVSDALSILRSVRSGPHAYDPDRPAGLRITVRKK